MAKDELLALIIAKSNSYLKGFGDLVKELEISEQRLQSLNKEMQSLSEEMQLLENIKEEFLEYPISFKQEEQQLDLLIASVGMKQKSLSDLLENQKSVKLGFEGLAQTSKLAASIYMPLINSAIEFETAMADVSRVVDFDTPEQFLKMRYDVQALAEEIPVASVALFELVTIGGKAGFAKDDLLIFAENAAKMGVAFDMTTSKAGHMMAEWRTVFRMNQDEVAVFADQVNYLSKTTVASASQISEVVQKVGYWGEFGGLTPEKVAALGTSMISLGATPDMAAMGITNLLSVMNSGDSATASQRKAFEVLGLSAEDMALAMQDDAQGAIMQVFEALQNIDTLERATVLGDLFGSNAIMSIAPLLNDLISVEDNFTKVAEASLYADSMQGEFASRSATTASQMQLMQNSLSNITGTLGEALLPTVNSFIVKLSDMINGFSTFARDNPIVIEGLLGTAAALLSIKAVSDVWKILSGSWAMAKAAHDLFTNSQQISLIATKASTAAQWLWNAAISAMPVFLVIAAIAGLIAICIALYNNWDDLAKWWDEIFAGLPEPVQKALTDVYDFFMGLWEGIKGIVTWIFGDHEINVSMNQDGTIGEQFGISPGQSDVDDLGNINAYADGGIVDHPQLALVGEAGPEAIIPLERLGEFSGSQSVSYSPQITINGSADKAVIKSALDEDFERFKTYMERLQREQRRVAMI